MPSDFETEFNNAVKKAAGEEYRRVREELLEVNQNEAAELLGYDVRQYQRFESGKGSPNLSKHFLNMFTLLKHYAVGLGKPKRSHSAFARCQGMMSDEQAEEYAQKEARRVLSKLISQEQRGDYDNDG